MAIGKSLSIRARNSLSFCFSSCMYSLLVWVVNIFCIAVKNQIKLFSDVLAAFHAGKTSKCFWQQTMNKIYSYKLFYM